MDITRVGEKVIERFGNDGFGRGPTGRRAFLGLLGRAAIACGVTGPFVSLLSRHAAAADAVRFDGWGGVGQAAQTKLIFDPMSAKTGVKVNQGSYGSLDEFLTKVRAGQPGEYNYFDLTNPLSYLQFIEAGYGVELDESRIPRLGSLMQNCVDQYRRLSKGKLSAVPCYFSSILIGYNRTKVDKAYVEAKGANILLDPAYKGRIASEDNWFRRIWYAALQTGQNPNDIKDMEAIWAKIRESRGIVVKYWKSGAEHMQLLAAGEADIADAWGVRIFNLQKQGHPIEGYVPRGLYVNVGSFMALKGSPLDPFYEMADILLRPEVQVALSSESGVLPLIDPTRFDMPPEVRARPGFDPTGQMKEITSVDPIYWNANTDAWQRQYQRVLSRG